MSSPYPSVSGKQIRKIIALAFVVHEECNFGENKLAGFRHPKRSNLRREIQQARVAKKSPSPFIASVTPSE